MISSQSALLLVILASSSILTWHSQIKLTPCLSLVIFISETSVVFVISLFSFLFLQLQRLPIHSSPTNLIIVIHSTIAFRKLTCTKYRAHKILWLVSLKYIKIWTHYTNTQKITLASNQTTHRLQTVFLHIKRFIYICDSADHKLFQALLHNPDHVLHQLLPPVKSITYELRPKAHDREIPRNINTLFMKTFIMKMIYLDSY